MRKFDRYLLAEMATPFTAGIVVMLMLLVGNQLYILLRTVYSAGAPIRDFGMMLLYYLPAVLVQAIPASVLLGVALALNRLERDRELQSMRLAGISLTRIITPVIIICILISVCILYLQDKVIPYTSHQAERIKMKISYQSPEAVIPSDQVIKLDNGTVVYVKTVDPRNHRLSGVIVWKPNPGKFPTLITIPIAENHDGQWMLMADPLNPQQTPRMYTFDEQGNLGNYIDVTGADSWMNMNNDIWLYITDSPTTAEELSIRQLLDLRKGVRLSMGVIVSDPKLLTYYLHRKFSNALAPLVAALLAIPLAVRFGRHGGFTGLLLSFIVAFCFVVSTQWAQVLTETRGINPLLGAWAPAVFFGLIGIIMLIREELGLRKSA
ncbi:MAG: LptF/LptG family permease [bacterium]